MGLTLPEPEVPARLVESARLILLELGRGPRTLLDLLDGVRGHDGPIGHGTLLAALARLEQQRLVEADPGADGRRAYRLGGEVKQA